MTTKKTDKNTITKPTSLSEAARDMIAIVASKKAGRTPIEMPQWVSEFGMTKASKDGFFDWAAHSDASPSLGSVMISQDGNISGLTWEVRVTNVSNNPDCFGVVAASGETASDAIAHVVAAWSENCIAIIDRATVCGRAPLVHKAIGIGSSTLAYLMRMYSAARLAETRRQHRV